MRLNLYDAELTRIAIIGDQFVSCAWSEGYNTVQSFTLELQATDEYKRKVRPDCYVGRDDRKTMMVIKTVRAQDGKLVASGKQAARCLDDVGFRGTIQPGAKIASAVKFAYDASYGFRRLRIASSELEDTYSKTISNKSILGLCTTMCAAADMGFRVVRSSGWLQTEFYKPEAKENAVLWSAFGNLRVQSLTDSTEQLRNHAIVLGAGEGDDRITVELDLSGGEQKRTLMVDARDLSQEDGESLEAYKRRLEARGFEKLLEHQPTLDCALDPNTGEFGTRYDLGDLVTVRLPEYGRQIRARVVRFTENAKKNATQLTVEVGSITILR